MFRTPNYSPLLVDEIVGRPSGDSIIFGYIAGVNTCRKGIIVLGDEGGGFFCSKGRMDAYYCKAFIFELFIYFLGTWEFLTARTTPDAPEIQKNGFSSKLR